MNGTQVVVGLGAAALIVANQVQHQPLSLGRVLGNVPGNLKIAESQWSNLLFEVIGGVVLTVIAGVGTGGPKIAIVVLVALWVIFLIKASQDAAATPKKAKTASAVGVLA